MRIGEVSQYIVKAYMSERDGREYGLLLLGPPGVGKSTSVFEAGEKIAGKLGKEFVRLSVMWKPGIGFTIDDISQPIGKVLEEAGRYFFVMDFRLSTIEPSDLTGIPRSRDGITYYDPLLWSVLYSCGGGILFLDELTWIQREDVWAIVPQIVLDKVAGMVKLSKETMVIASGNRPEDASGLVRLIHNPLLNRFKIIEVSPPSPQEWAEWMGSKFGDNWDKSTLAFIMGFAGDGYMLKVPKTGEGLSNFPTPRTWAWVARDRVLGFDSLADAIGLLGEEVGRKYHAFANSNINLAKLLDEPQQFKSLDFDKKYMAPLLAANYIAGSGVGSEAAGDPAYAQLQAQGQGQVQVQATGGGRQASKKLREQLPKGKEAVAARMSRCLGLVDAMAEESIEFVSLLIISLPKSLKFDFIKMLMDKRPRIGEGIKAVALNIVGSI